MRILFALSLALAAIPARAADSRSALALVARLVRADGDCGTSVPLELNESYPVPVKIAGALRFRTMYYRVTKARKKRLQAGEPVFVAEFGGDGKGGTCAGTAVPKAGSPGPVLSPEARKLGFAAFRAKQDALYAAIEKVSAAYAAGRADDEARRSAKEFAGLWAPLHEPTLSVQYTELSPEFWRWLDSL